MNNELAAIILKWLVHTCIKLHIYQNLELHVMQVMTLAIARFHLRTLGKCGRLLKSANLLSGVQLSAS